MNLQGYIIFIMPKVALILVFPSLRDRLFFFFKLQTQKPFKANYRFFKHKSIVGCNDVASRRISCYAYTLPFQHTYINYIVYFSQEINLLSQITLQVIRIVNGH